MPLGDSEDAVIDIRSPPPAPEVVSFAHPSDAHHVEADSNKSPSDRKRVGTAECSSNCKRGKGKEKEEVYSDVAKHELSLLRAENSSLQVQVEENKKEMEMKQKKTLESINNIRNDNMQVAQERSREEMQGYYVIARHAEGRIRDNTGQSSLLRDQAQCNMCIQKVRRNITETNEAFAQDGFGISVHGEELEEQIRLQTMLDKDAMRFFDSHLVRLLLFFNVF